MTADRTDVATAAMVAAVLRGKDPGFCCRRCGKEVLITAHDGGSGLCPACCDEHCWEKSDGVPYCIHCGVMDDSDPDDYRP